MGLGRTNTTLAEATRPGQPRRVLAVVRWPVGGIRTHLLYTYPRLFDAGYRFSFVGPADEGFRSFAREVSDWPEIECFEAPVSGDHCQFRPLVRQLLATGRYQIVHSHGLLAAGQVALADWRVRVPHVVTSQDVFRPEQVTSWKGRLKRWGVDQLLSRSTALVAVSEDVRQNHLDWLPRLARSRCRVVTIPNGIDLARFEPGESGGSGSLVRGGLKLAPGQQLWGFLGRFMEQKGFLTLVGAIDRLARQGKGGDFHLLAVGSGDFEREYQTEVNRRGLGHLITFRQFVPHVNRILRELDLLVMPSLWEACPLLPMEAMIAGTPVLGTDCLGLREVLEGTPSVMVPHGQEQPLAEALARSLDRPWTSAAQAYAGAARERFHIDHCARQLTWLFDELTGGWTGSAASSPETMVTSSPAGGLSPPDPTPSTEPLLSATPADGVSTT